MAIDQRQDHGVDRHRLARAGSAGDEQVRHAREIGDHRLAPDRLAEAERQLVLSGLEILAGEQLAQVDGLALVVGEFDADRVAARDHGDARRHGAHRACDVIGERDHPRRLRSRRRLELVERDDRSGAHIDDLALHAEILERAFKKRRVLFQRLLGDRRHGRTLRLREQRPSRKLILALVEQRGLRLLGDPLAGAGSRRRRSDPRGGRLAPRNRHSIEGILVVILVLDRR